MHRVQRVPAGEKRGRRHSSVVTVVALSAADNVAGVNRGAVRVDIFRASGPGGQHRNKVETGVRLTDPDTGIVVTATESRSQQENRQLAWRRLEEAVAERARKASHDAVNGDRAAAFGQGRAFTWTSWRDEVKWSGGRTSMSAALAGKLGPLLR